MTHSSTRADSTPYLRCQQLVHRYGDHQALRGVDLQVNSGEIFALLGPNGSGKTTLFRLISTMMPIQQGEITIAGIALSSDLLAARQRLGIVFQSPSLDKKLTVDENIACQAALYGMSSSLMKQRRDEVLQVLNLTDRRHDVCEKLSGGLKRRVELAKGLLHRPSVMLLDEPSTGLDPSARLDLWQYLRGLADQGMAILLTTHLLEEADKADRIAILAQGQVIAEGSPQRLRAEMGEGLITIVTGDADLVERILKEEFGLASQRLQDSVRVQSGDALALLPKLATRLGTQVDSITIGRPTLEDLFIEKTGQRF